MRILFRVIFGSLRKSLCVLPLFFLLTILSINANVANVNPVNPALLELLDLMQIEHDGTLESIVEQTQKYWLLPAGKERWQVVDLPPEISSQVIALAYPLGLMDEIRPLQTTYDYCLIVGASVKPLKARFNYMCQLWAEGIRFSEVIFLASERPLDPMIENYPGCATESDVARAIWNDTVIPDEVRALPVTFIYAPMIHSENGVRRATMVDTIQSWLGLSPNSGTCLFVTSQPYCFYHNAVTKICIPASFISETVGPAASPNIQKGSVLLDSIARWLYYELRAKKNNTPTSDLPKSP